VIFCEWHCIRWFSVQSEVSRRWTFNCRYLVVEAATTPKSIFIISHPQLELNPSCSDRHKQSKNERASEEIEEKKDSGELSFVLLVFLLFSGVVSCWWDVIVRWCGWVDWLLPSFVVRGWSAVQESSLVQEPRESKGQWRRRANAVHSSFFCTTSPTTPPLSESKYSHQPADSDLINLFPVYLYSTQCTFGVEELQRISNNNVKLYPLWIHQLIVVQQVLCLQ